MKTSIIKLNDAPPGFGTVADCVEESVIGDPIQHTYEYYSDDAIGLSVGLWDTTDMLEAAGPYSMDEFMLVLEGQAIIHDQQRKTRTTIKAGESFAIPKGFDCQWQQKGYLRKFFFISCHPGEPIPATPAYDGVVLPKVQETTSRPTHFNPFLLDDFGSADYIDSRGRFRVNSWTTEPFESQARPFPRHQLSIVQAGSIDIVDEHLNRHQFITGDVFFIPKGTLCAAKSLDHMSFISASLSA